MVVALDVVFLCGMRDRVLAAFDDRPLKYNRKTGPTRNGLGSPKLRLRAILSPASFRRRVYEVRSAPVNRFDNTEKSVPVRAVSLFRNGASGGVSGVRTAGAISPFGYVLQHTVKGLSSHPFTDFEPLGRNYARLGTTMPALGSNYGRHTTKLVWRA